MAGIVDHSLATVRHVCRPPEIYEFGEPRSAVGVPTVTCRHPLGTRFHCDCGRVWVVRVHVPQYRLQPRGGLEWAPETRAQRRRRLGLRWWQR